MRNYGACVALVLLAFAAALTGCKKTNDIIPDAVTGNIFGKYSPARAAANIVAVSNPENITTAAKLDSSSNGFNITGLAAGNYLVRFRAKPGFIAPDSITVSLKAGENYDVGTVVFKPTPTPTDTSKHGSISGKILPATPGITIAIKNAGGTRQFGGVPDATGAFKIDGITPDSYELSIAPTLQYATPASLKVNVTAGNNTDIGTIMLSPTGNKGIDTIPDLVYISDAAGANAFIARAANDSAIVLLASFYANRWAISTGLLAAMNKIIVAKSIFSVDGASGTLTLSGLKEAAQLSVTGPGLTKLDLPQLTVASIVLRDCPALADINVPALTRLGSLTIYNTGLTGLTAFKSANFKPLTLEIRKNEKLTSLAGLNFVADSLYDCNISYNTVLTNLNGLQAVKRFTHEIVIIGNPVLQSLTGLENAVYARRLTLTYNPQLSAICPAKVLLNYLKDTPAFKEWRTGIDGVRTQVTLQPLVATSNGSYATKVDLLAAVALCP